jgi:non-reducing end alpha-L-arabinofuranosidase
MGTGGMPATGGRVGTGGAPGTGGATGSGGAARAQGPCDIYAAAGAPCAAAYSMVRALSRSYTGPLYQVRSGSSAMNTGMGGLLRDIGMTADGFADTATQDTFCSGTICTVSLLYDHSGNGNHLPVAKRGRPEGGTFAAMDDFESAADKGTLMIGGRKVYSLYMNAREGYRLMSVGRNMPLGSASQGIYMLADGMHYGMACCWDFGNVTTDPLQFATMNTLFFGVAFWGKGAGSGPWMMADFEGGVWAGGSLPGDPGWGGLAAPGPANTNNPSLKVPFAFGALKTSTNEYALRMADMQSATSLTTAYRGALPKPMDNKGGIVLGVAGDNSNNSFGTFYEGAIVAGYPTDATELAVFNNIRAVGYSR